MTTTVDTGKFHAHGAIPEDLAHKIFEVVNDAVRRASGLDVPNALPPGARERFHEMADFHSQEIQQAVAEAFSDLTFKLVNRKGF